MPQDDQQLIADSLLGDERAFEQLLSRYLTPVYNFIVGLTRDRIVAEDLAQETFIKAWKHLTRFDQKRNLGRPRWSLIPQTIVGLDAPA